MKLLGTVVVAAGIVAFAPVADAQWYASGNAGVAMLEDADTTFSAPGQGVTGDFEFDTGFVFSGAIGRKFGAFRAEGEISYRGFDMDTVNATITSGAFAGLTASAPVEGDASALAFMLNGFYDFNTGTPFIPYVGVGLGLARVNVETDSIGGVAASSDETDTVFAYQAAAGIGYQVNPNTIVSVEYRYFGTSDPEFEDGGTTTETEVSIHNFMAGVRFFF